MIDSLTSNNYGDFRQRYEKTYGFMLNEDGKKTLAYIHGVNSNKVVFNTIDGNDFYANADKGINWEFLPITRGWYYTRKQGPVLLARVPAKQYHRGISDNNTSCHFLKNGNFQQTRVSLEMLHDIFVEKAVMPESMGYIISKYFYASPTALFGLATKMGTVDLKNKIIKMEESTFTQELSDFIRRGGFTLRVENVNN